MVPPITLPAVITAPTTTAAANESVRPITSSRSTISAIGKTPEAAGIATAANGISAAAITAARSTRTRTGSATPSNFGSAAITPPLRAKSNTNASAVSFPTLRFIAALSTESRGWLCA